MARCWECKGPGSSTRWSRWQHPDFLIAKFDGMTWQGAPWRPGQRTAIFGAEGSFVARTDQLVRFIVEMHRALQVRAALTLRDKSVDGEANQNARVSFGRITEKLRAADGNLLRARDDFGLGRDLRLEQFAFGEPGGPKNRSGTTGEHGELASRHAMFFRLADWEVAIPMRFAGHGIIPGLGLGV